jgi:hypothetical protein
VVPTREAELKLPGVMEGEKKSLEGALRQQSIHCISFHVGTLTAESEELSKSLEIPSPGACFLGQEMPSKDLNDTLAFNLRIRANGKQTEVTQVQGIVP